MNVTVVAAVVVAVVVVAVVAELRRTISSEKSHFLCETFSTRHLLGFLFKCHTYGKVVAIQ